MKKIICLLWLSGFYSLLWAQPSWSPLPPSWQFYQTADAGLHYDQIADEDWQTVTASQLLKTNPKQGIYGWYKVDFTWSKPNESLLLLYLQRIRHADEAWVNGEKIGGLGQLIQPWQLKANNPNNLARKYHLAPGLLTAGNNTLAIKINLGFGQVWGAMLPGGVGLGGEQIGIGSKAVVNELYTQQILHEAIIDTALIVLGLIDIFIITFLFRRSIHHFHEFWWLLIGSVVMMCSALLLDYFYVLNWGFSGSKILLLLSLLSSPFVSAMYFWSIHKNVSKPIVLVAAGVGLVMLLLIVWPGLDTTLKDSLWLVWSGFTIILLAYCLFSALSGVRKHFVGAGFQLFGLVVFLLSIRTQWLPVDLFEHRNIVVGSLVLRYSLLFSYFQRINQMSQDYKRLSSRLLSTIENHKQEIARDLHDDLGQHLSAAKLQFLSYYQGRTKEAIGFIQQEINAALQSLRELMQGLHPLILEQYPFAEALQQEGERVAKREKVDISVSITRVELNKNKEKHLFRIFQEVLHNAIKHGRAQVIRVTLQVDKHRVRLQVSDDGVGFKAKKTAKIHTEGGFGLVSLRERIALLDGRIRVQSKPNEGTTVVISLPR